MYVAKSIILSTMFKRNCMYSVTTQSSSPKVLKIFTRNKELIHCRKKKNSRRKKPSTVFFVDKFFCIQLFFWQKRLFLSTTSLLPGVLSTVILPDSIISPIRFFPTFPV